MWSSSSSSLHPLFVLLLPRLFFYVCSSTSSFLRSFTIQGGLFASFSGFLYFLLLLCFFFLVDVPVTIFCVFFFNSPASSSPSLGSIISNKRTLLFCFVYLFASVLLWFVCACVCVGMDVFFFMYVCE